MKCQNCGINEANFRYTQVINGVKKELALCEECSKKMGLASLDFNIPINFSSFLGDFVDEEEDLIPSFLLEKNKLKCEKCGMTYDDFVNAGKFGCSNCYETFKNKIDSVIKNIQGTNKHIGRKYNNNELIEPNSENEIKVEDKKDDDIKILKDKLKRAIAEERYEDAAKLRDEIKEKEQKGM